MSSPNDLKSKAIHDTIESSEFKTVLDERMRNNSIYLEKTMMLDNIVRTVAEYSTLGNKDVKATPKSHTRTLIDSLNKEIEELILTEKANLLISNYSHVLEDFLLTFKSYSEANEKYQELLLMKLAIHQQTQEVIDVDVDIVRLNELSERLEPKIMAAGTKAHATQKGIPIQTQTNFAEDVGEISDDNAPTEIVLSNNVSGEVELAIQ